MTERTTCKLLHTFHKCRKKSARRTSERASPQSMKATQMLYMMLLGHTMKSSLGKSVRCGHFTAGLSSTSSKHTMHCVTKIACSTEQPFRLLSVLVTETLWAQRALTELYRQMHSTRKSSLNSLKCQILATIL